MKRGLMVIGVVALGLIGCGSDEDGGGGPSPGAQEPSDGGSGGPGEGPVPGTTPTRRLTKTEYLNTVEALFGSNFDAASEVPGDEYRGGFDNGGQRFSVSEMIVRQYMTVATSIASKVDVAKVVPCDTTKVGEVGCATELATKLGGKAYRRPLESSEVTELVGLYSTIRATGTHQEALRAMIARMLIAPQFLYHVELGEAPPSDGSSPSVTPFELASRLSYLLWESMPDSELLDAAATGKLKDRAAVLGQVERLLGDARAKKTVWHMNEQWLELNRYPSAGKDSATYPGFDGAKADIYEGTKRFVEDAFWNGKGDLRTLLTGNYTFANAKVAQVYGFSSTGNDFVRVELDPNQSSGILSQPAFLATLGKADRSAPILRAIFVRDRLMCSSLPPPPPGASDTKTDAKPKTTREYFTIVTSPPQCMSCHSVINPIGFGFENFDGIGKWRTTENGVAVDASGQIDLDDGVLPFVGAAQLGKILVDSPRVQDCVTRHWFRFAYGHEETREEADVVVKAATERFRKDSLSMRTLPRALVEAEPFYRLHYSLNVVKP